MNKLEKRIREVEEEHAEETLNGQLAAHDEKRRDNALIILGGINVAKKIAQAISAESMRALIVFQEEKIYESLGYENFVDFLNKSEYAPMTKSQFYERKALLENEGDIAFDLLNSFSMPVSTRKLLGKGNIQLDGETLIVTDPANDEEIRIELSNKPRILETLTALADANADKSSQLGKQKDALQKAEEAIGELKDEFERVKNEKILASENSHSSALSNLVAAFGLLTIEAEKLSAIEKEQFAPRTFETIASLMSRLSDGYNRKDWAKEMSKSGKSKTRKTAKDDDDFLIEQVLNDNEEDNDKELANLI